MTVATLCGARSLEAAAQFACDRGRGFAESLGFTHSLTRVRKNIVMESTEVVYGITNLSRQRSDAEALIGHARIHFGIETRLRHVHNVTIVEDGCRVRSGSALQILAAIRNLTIPSLREIQPKNVAVAMRHLAVKPRKALKLADEPGESNGPCALASPLEVRLTGLQVRYMIAIDGEMAEWSKATVC